MASSRVTDNISRNLYTLDDETNPRGSKRQTVWPSTTLDQVFDQERSDHKTLRQIIADLRQEILTGGKGNIVFPVTTVNGMDGDVEITPETLGLGNVDNTRDIDKPLSDPQRLAVQQILATYDFNVNLQELYDHLVAGDNPHGVSLEHINKDGALDKLINQLINKHNFSTQTNIHTDIRRSLSNLWTIVDQMDDDIDDRIDAINRMVETYFTDAHAHQNLFDLKEDVAHKTSSLENVEVVNHTNYPSARAVVEYVANKISEFNKTIPHIENWIDDITTVRSRTDIPEPSSKYLRKAYIVQCGEGSYSELAVCRLTTDDRYYWDYSPISISKFNPKQFYDSLDGLTINTAELVESILNQEGVLEQTLKEILSGYYNAQQIDDFGFIRSIHFLPGTMDGHIRFYINNDERTMSKDIPVAGLQRCAYLEWITENELYDQSVHERHIVNRGIVSRHIRERAVTPEKIDCPPGYLIGNIKDTSGEAQFLKIDDMKLILEDIDEISEDKMVEIWENA